MQDFNEFEKRAKKLSPKATDSQVIEFYANYLEHCLNCDSDGEDVDMQAWIDWQAYEGERAAYEMAYNL